MKRFYHYNQPKGPNINSSKNLITYYIPPVKKKIKIKKNPVQASTMYHIQPYFYLDNGEYLKINKENENKGTVFLNQLDIGWEMV